MGRKARLKRKRRAERERIRHAQRKRLGFALAPCSFKRCPNGRPPGTHILRLRDGTHYTACDDCANPMMVDLKRQGIDAQVATVSALEHLKNNPPSPAS